MNSFDKLKTKLKGIGLDFTATDTCDSALTWLGDLFIHGIEPAKDYAQELRKWLKEELEFKFIEEGSSDNYDSHFSVISLEGKLYKLNWETSSSEEISGYTDFYSWKLVSAKTKTVNSYE